MKLIKTASALIIVAMALAACADSRNVGSASDIIDDRNGPFARHGGGR